MYKHKIILNTYREGETTLYEVMETVNLTSLVPGHIFRINSKYMVSDFIMQHLHDEDSENNIKEEDIEIILKHGHESKVIRIKDPIEIKNGPYSSFEIRHDNGGSLAGTESALCSIADALNEVSNSIDNINIKNEESENG
jgi:hypothetical protein